MDLYTTAVSSQTVLTWQDDLDLLAEVVQARAVLLLTFDRPPGSVLAGSVLAGNRSSLNPYVAGDQLRIDVRAFEKTRDAVLISGDGNQEPQGSTNGIKPFPAPPLCVRIDWPSGELFGAIAVLDSGTTQYDERAGRALVHFRRTIESDLALLEIEKPGRNGHSYRGLLPDNDLSHRSSAAGTITALNSITAEPARAEPEKAASSPPRNGFGQLTPLLRGLLDNTAAIVYLLDADERYLFVNRRWEEVFHMSSDQVSGKTMYDVFPRQIAEAFHLVNEAVRRTGKQIETEEVAPHDDGFHTYISLKFPFLDEEGNPRAVCGISTDITERKKAEEELRASKESFQRLFEDSPFPFWEMDMSGVKKYIDGLRSQGVEPVAYLREKPEAVLRCVRATRSVRFNKATLRLNGAETEAALLEWFSRALADKSQMHLSNFRDLVLSLAEGKSSFELRGVASVMNGGLINYMCRAIILPGCEDTWSRVLISTLDLTNNVRAEETKAYLAAIVESSGDAIIGSTIDGKIKSWNKGAERVYGYSAEEAIGRSVAFLMPSDRIDDFGSITETLRSGKSVEQYETVRGAKDGRRIYVSLTVSPIKDSQGVITGSSAVARDITEQKRAENDLREAKERYETLFQEAPVSLYELDLSGTKQKLDELRAAGVTDIDSYFDNNPGDLTECALRYQLIRANKTTLKLQGAGSFEDLAHWIQDALRDESGLIRRIFRDVIVTLNSGPTIYEAERVATTLGGNQTDILTRVMIAPGYEDSWASVLVSAIDLTDLRRAEEARSQLAVIVESSDDAIFANTADGVITSWNKGAERLYGYSAEEMIGRQLSLIVAPECRHEIGIVRDLLNRGESVEQFETVQVAKDGRRIDASITVSPMRDPGGTRTGAATISRDITDRKRADEALRRSQLEYSNLVNTIDGIVWKADAQTFKFSFVSKQAERILGYPVQRWLDEPDFWKEHIYPEDRDWVVDYCVDATAERRDHEFRYRMIDATGRVRWLHDFVRVMVEDDQPVELRGVMVDITERETAEESLRKSEEELRLFFELDVAANFVSTPDGRILRCNPAFARMFGFNSVTEAVENGAAALYPSGHSRKQFLTLLESRKRLEHLEEDLRRKDGSIIHVIGNVIGSFDAQGRLTEIRGYLMDDTERRKAEEQLRQSQKLEAIGRLAGGVAHDFNNILTIILGYAQLLLRKIPRQGPLYEEALQIRSAGERASALTNQLLAFSRKQILQPRVLSLNEIVANMDKMLRRVIGEDIDLVTIPDPSAGMVRADLGQIEQVILNLAVNARDAMPNGGRLTIETTNVSLDEPYIENHIGAKAGRYVMFAVSDNGAGMNEEVRSHIFEPFFTTKESGRGTGLGLSTVYGIVKQSGGNIWVYSEPGKGSSFKVYLPRVDEAPEAPSVLPSAEPDIRGAETVLVVEDEAPVRALSVKSLRDAGYTVLEAGDANEALSLFGGPAGQDVQMLVTDVIMPGIGGKELADRITAARPAVKVLFVTGYTDNAIVHHGYLDAGIEVLQKPFTPSELARRVRQILDGVRQSEGSR